MSLQIASIASGSNGNCYYVGNDTEAVLIDAGISCRETEARAARMGLDLKKVKAVFISHEHTDHIMGVSALAKKYELPVYITPRTLGRCRVFLKPQYIVAFYPHQTITVGQLRVTPFPKLHDGCDPHSFTVTEGDTTIGVLTDIGEPCEHVVHYFNTCHAAFLESNYDDVMLEQGRYPVHLKRRISGSHGHLSNKQALELFLAHGSHMSHILLSHLSRDNNHPDLARDLFLKQAGRTQIVIAGRYKETDIYEVSGNGPALKAAPTNRLSVPAQLALF